MSRHLQQCWLRAMREGAFERAWQIGDRIMDERIARFGADLDSRAPRHCQTVWNGRPLAARHVLVRCYHGLGDTVQFIRFARQLRSIAREVSVWAQPQLLRLVAGAQGVDRVRPLHDGSPDLPFDVDIEVMELAHALRITAPDLPGPVPYLYAQPHGDTGAPHHDFTVGLVWSGGDWDARRSLHFDQLSTLLHVSGVRFVSLQRGAPAAQRATRAVADLGSDDVDVFASRLRRLDLLISIDTFAAHLAGALGVPVWTLLHSECDWRWGDHGTRSVWYPTMRLFRQRTPGAWEDVIEDVACALVTERDHARRSQGTKQPA